jgi:hypothetical protein
MTARFLVTEILFALLGIAVFILAIMVVTPLVAIANPKSTLTSLAGVGRYAADVASSLSKPRHG